MNQSLDISFGFHFPWIEWRSQETWQWWYEINMSITVSVMESLFSFSYRKINGHGLISSSSEDIILFGVDPPWYDFDCYSRLISSRCVNCRCWGSWRTLHGKMVTFSNKCCNNIPRCLSSWWRWGQCPGWRGRPCTGSRHPAPPAHSTRWWEWRPRTRRRTACCWWKSACYRLTQTSP